MWYILHKYTIKNVYIHNSPVVEKTSSARCGGKYIRNKLRTSVLSGTVVQFWTIMTKTTFTHF